MFNFMRVIASLFLLSSVAFAQSTALNAFKADGLDDFAFPLTPNAAGLSQGTIELWFSADTWTSSIQIWGGGNGFPGSNSDWTKLGSHPSVGSDQLAFGEFAGIWWWAKSGQTPVAGTWYHVAATWGGGGLKIYLNGVLAGQSGFVSALENYTTELIATSSWGGYFAGAIDEVRIWNIALDSASINKNLLDTLSTEYYSTSDSGLIAYYRMDTLEDLGVNGDGDDDFRDLSVNANHLDTGGDPFLAPSGAFMLTDIKEVSHNIPNGINLGQNYPNPFNPETTIEFNLPVASVVTLEIFDVMGRRVVGVQRAVRLPAGTHKWEWNGTDASDNPVVSGVYFYRLQFENVSLTRKMMLLR